MAAARWETVEQADQGVTMSELCRAWVEDALAEHFG